MAREGGGADCTGAGTGHWEHFKPRGQLIKNLESQSCTYPPDGWSNGWSSVDGEMITRHPNLDDHPG